MSKSWIRTILLMALAVLCLIGAVVMKACGQTDAVDAPYTEVDSSSSANSNVVADSAAADDSSSAINTEIKVVFSDEEDDSASASVEEQDESEAAEQSSAAEEEVPAAPTPAVTSEPVVPQPTEEPTVVATPVPAPESTVVPVPEPNPAPTPVPVPEPAQPASKSTEQETLQQNIGYADNGWQPEAVEHYHGSGTDAGTCPACGLIYGPAGGAEGQYGEQDGLMD